MRGLYPRLSGREHILYYGRLHGLVGEALERRVDELMDRLEMGDFAHRRCKGYSRGQELKVALARALVHEPQNMIFDEPANGLDVTSSRSVHDLIREMRDQIMNGDTTPALAARTSMSSAGAIFLQMITCHSELRLDLSEA